MATVVFGALGAAAGSAIPGIGWKLGWSIGTVVGGLIEGVGRTGNVSGGRLTDLRISGSAYGSDIPRIWGSMRVPGNVIWVQKDADGNHLVEHSETESVGGGGSGGLGGGGSSTTYWYSSTFSVAFMNAVLHYADDTLSTRTFSLKRIYADDKIIWDADEASHTIDVNVNTGSETQAIDSTISAAESGVAPAYRGIAYVTFNDLDLRDYGNRIPNISAVWECDVTVYISDMLNDLAKMSGLTSSELDFTGDIAAEELLGYFLGGTASANDVYDEVLGIYGYDLVEYDGKLHAVKRGGASAHTYTDAEINVGNEAPTVERTLGVINELPARLNLTYYDGEAVDGKIPYLQKTQSDIRQVDDSLNTLDISTNLLLTTALAKKYAAANLDMIWAETERVKLSVSPALLELTPGDAVTYAGKRWRIVSESGGLPVSAIEHSLVPDDASALTQSVSGSGGGTGNSKTNVAYPSTFVVWSGKEIQDEHRIYPGFYVAATGADPGWTGCTVYYSLDGGTTYNSGAFITGRTPLGASVSTLSSAGAVAGSYDVTNTVDVTLEVTGTLASCSATEIDAGTNIAALGDEIIGFRGVSSLGTLQYRLSNIKRGLRDSTMTGHTSSDKFAVFNRNISRINVPDSMIGGTVYVKCVSRFQTLADVTAKTVVIATPTPGSVSLGGVVEGGTSGSILFIDSNLKMAQDNSKLFWDDTNNQLQLGQTGSAGGILIGGDTQLYRSAADVLRTPDSLQIDGNIITGNASELRLFNAANYSGFRNGALASNLIYTLPATAPTAGYVLSAAAPSGGYSQLSWIAPGGGALSDGDYGDITVGGSGTTMTIDNDVVTYAKMQNISATSRILGRKTALAGDTEECTLSEILDFIGSAAQGDILYRGAASWARLGASTSGYVLKTQGAAANPTWALMQSAIQFKDEGVNIGSNGAVTSVNFTGVGVTATESGGAVTVNITGTGYTLSIGNSISLSTIGSILFVDGSNQIQEDNANLFWDDTNNTMGVGTTRTGAISGTNPRLRVKGTGTTSATSSFEVQDSAAAVLFFVRNDGLINFGTKGTYTESTGQLALSTSGSGAGVLLGGDALLYRSAADILRTPDSLTVDTNLLVSGTATFSGLTATRVTFAGTAGLLSDSANFTYTTGTGQLALATSGSGAGLLLGGDALLYRTAADIFRTPDSLVIDTKLGVGTTTGTLTYLIEAKGATTSTFIGKNTSASSSSAGAGFTFAHDDGAAMASGDRLAFLLFAGARDASNTLNNSAGIQAFADENWSGTSCAAYLAFETCPTTSTTRVERMRIASGGQILFGATVNNVGYNILFGGEAAYTIGMNRRQASNSAGNKLVIRGGGATDTTGGFTLATNKNGGDVEIRGGISTGTGYSGVSLQAFVLGSTGTADNSASTLFRVDGSVAGGAVGFFGTTPAAKQTSGANLTNNVTSGGTNNQIDDFTSLTVYSTDAATIRNNIYQLARKLKQVNDALRTYGLLT